MKHRGPVTGARWRHLPRAIPALRVVLIAPSLASVIVCGNAVAFVPGDPRVAP